MSEKEEDIWEAFARVLAEHEPLEPSLDFEGEHVARCYVQALCNLREQQRPALDENIFQEMLDISGRDRAWKLKKHFGF
jgi:hypothetical protein